MTDRRGRLNHRMMTGANVMLSMLLVTGIGFIIGCTSGTPSIEVEEPQAVLAPYIIGCVSVYMEIVNNGSGADSLKNAQVDTQGTLTELHDTQDRRMVKTDHIRIPAGKGVRLRPGGPHIMVFKLPKDVTAGASLTLSLFFEKSGEKKVLVPIVNDYLNSSARRK